MNVKVMGSLVLAVVLTSGSAFAQGMTEKPARYTYVASFTYPRAHWGEVEQQNAVERKIFEAALANGTVVGYGWDEDVVHSPDSYTHDSWWTANSFAGILKVLATFANARNADAPVLATATKHADMILVSRFYNGHPGSWKDVYTYAQTYKLKADAPDDAIQSLSKNLIAPFMEKLLADGTILQFEIDTEAVHKNAPGTFYVFYIAQTAENVDKARAAQAEILQSSPLSVQAFGSMTEEAGHRDDLYVTTATYK